MWPGQVRGQGRGHGKLENELVVSLSTDGERLCVSGDEMEGSARAVTSQQIFAITPSLFKIQHYLASNFYKQVFCFGPVLRADSFNA